MKALVVGGNGFIGSHLVDLLLKSGWEVSVLDLQERRFEILPRQVHFVKGDLSQAYLVREVLLGVDVVFHLAWATIHEVANQDPVADIEFNLMPSIRLLEASRNAGVKRFIFTSSGGTVYGPTQVTPIPETHAQNPINAYGVTKLAMEKYLHMFAHLYGLDYAIFRPSVPYGPRQNPFARQGAVAVFLHRVANGLPVNIWGDGSVVRDYFYVSDLTDALLAAAEQTVSPNCAFNIGGPEQVSLTQLLALVEETVKKQAIVEYKPARPFDVPRVVLDTTLAKKSLGWQPKINIINGLATTWDWMSTAIN